MAILFNLVKSDNCVSRIIRTPYSPFHHFVQHPILPGKLAAAPMNVHNAIQIDEVCMGACENKLPHGFCEQIGPK